MQSIGACRADWPDARAGMNPLAQEVYVAEMLGEEFSKLFKVEFFNMERILLG